MRRALPLLSILATACAGGFDPDERYRCATDDDCLAGYRCAASLVCTPEGSGPDAESSSDSGVVADGADIDLADVDLGVVDGSSDADADEPPGTLNWSFSGTAYEALAVEGATVRVLSDELAAIGAPSGYDEAFRRSPEGTWLAGISDRFGCPGWSCLVVMDGQLVDPEAIYFDNDTLHPHYVGGITEDGALVVYADEGGPVYVISRGDLQWRDRVELTAASDYPHFTYPVLRADAQRVVMECGNEPFSVSTGICDVAIDGSDFRVLAQPTDLGTADDSLNHPTYMPSGHIVFVSTWSGADQLWRMNPDGSEVQQLNFGELPVGYPCALPSGHIAYVLDPDYDGVAPYAIKMMDAKGKNPVTLVDEVFPPNLVVSLKCSR